MNQLVYNEEIKSHDLPTINFNDNCDKFGK